MAETFSIDIGGRPLSIEIGRVAEQASGAVLTTYGDTVVLTTVCTAEAREGIDFFPLTVDYEERHYAVGRIPGSFFRREGRPPQNAILSARLTDRCLRPLFPKGFRNEVQVISTVLSADQENPPELLSIIGASTALAISAIPFDSPVGATRLGYLDGEFIINPTFSQVEEGLLDMVVAGTADAIIMVESGAKEVSEQVLLDAMRKAQEINQQLVAFQQTIAAKVGTAKMTYVTAPAVPSDLETELSNLAKQRVDELFEQGAAKGERNASLDALQDEAVESLSVNYDKKQVVDTFEKLLKDTMRARILEKGKRPDNRGIEEIRPITVEVGILPRTHGTGLFQRGQTQVLTIATLGSLSMTQTLDSLDPESSKRYMHHYNFPPYSVGEVRRLGTGRREIGHGALAERALEPVIPSQEEFPYAIRLVSEVLSSNGSTSMGSVCGSTLALMDAGVPIKTPIAGIAMGLIMDKETHEYAVLTDIQGIEDFQGDMDFKVAGSADGITALQMDVKITGIDFAVMEKALEQAKRGRLFILDKMMEAIRSPRENLSPYAPRMLKLSIPVDKIGAIIGPGGKTIRAMTQEYQVTIDIEPDGSVVIGSANEDSAQNAYRAITGLVKDPEVGEIYTGKVTRIVSFGAFVEILPGKDGLVHISEITDHRIDRVEDEIQLGDEVTVMITEIDRMGRLNLSRRALLSTDSSNTNEETGNEGSAGHRPDPNGQSSFQGEGGGQRPFSPQQRGGRGGRPGGYGSGPRT